MIAGLRKFIAGAALLAAASHGRCAETLATVTLAPSEPAVVTRSGNQVTVFSGNRVGPEESVHGDAVAVCGNLQVDGDVSGQAVAVMGDLTINGTVHGKAEAVMGNLTLGPNSVVDGDVVCVGGGLRRAQGSVVKGRIQVVPFPGVTSHGKGLPRIRVHPPGQGNLQYRDYLYYDYDNGRGSFWPFAPFFHLGILRGLALVLFLGVHLVLLGFYVLIALLFPSAIRRVGDMLTERPGLSLLCALLAIVALPPLFVILCVSVIGIPFAFALPIACVMLGKASFYGRVGRAVSARLALPAAVIVGGLICLVVFWLPLFGLFLSLLIDAVMVGCVVAALITHANKPARQAAAAPPPPAVYAPVPPAPEPPPAPPISSMIPTIPPPLAAAAPASPSEPSAALPRAGFWIRVLALMIDTVIVSCVTVYFVGPAFLLALAIYGACFWKLKGTTIGGIVTGLKVVRLDDRPVEWDTAIVRALSCFLSLVFFGLGFVWIAFDPQHQAWHDKIAGTVVVRPTRGISLV